MIEFVDLNNGQVFNGTDPNYVFWFDGEQSTNLIYTKNICILSKNSKLTIKIQENPTFSLLDLQKVNKHQISENEFSLDYKKYNDIKTFNYTSKGEKYNNVYLHNIYIAASNKIAGEYREQIYITENKKTEKIRIGIDLYDENESLYINLANMGVEIPESFQKALYDSNIKEDYKDNILINRKFKELLINYWNMIANKGSYKSLINSLKWFEYRDEKGDLVRLREIWKGKRGPVDTYADKELCSILEDKYKELLYDYSKTSYFALQAALERVNPNNYDSEKNPELERITYKWSVEELSLKMTLLGQFYEAFFMPIHTSLIHSTIEDVVFTNTLKSITSGIIDRYDFNYSLNYIKCNIKDHQIFKLGNVNARVNNNTIFKNEVIDKHVPVIGVDDLSKSIDPINNVIKTFSDQYYTGVGVIIPIELEVMNMDTTDSIKQVQIRLQDDDSNEWIVKTFYDIFPENKINFNLLCKKEKDYKVLITIITKDCRTYTRDINWSVVDMDNCYIEINKLIADSKLDINKVELEVQDYLFKRQPGINKTEENDVINKPDFYTQYLPSPNLKLNNVLVFNYDKNEMADKIEDLNKFYFVFYKNKIDNNGKITDEKKYLICVSKTFEFNPNYYTETQNFIIRYKKYLIRNDYGFFPMFYHYKPLYKKDHYTNYNIKDFQISNKDTVCVKPHIKYGKYIKEYEWTFENASTGQLIEMPISSQYPFIANDKKEFLPKGYYNIIFKCSLIDGQVRTLKLDSAFIIV